MSTVRTAAAPNAAMFATDPLEQIFAKQMFDPANSGYAAAMLMGAKQDRGDNVAQYLASLSQSNESNMRMQQIEAAQKAQAEQQKAALDMADKLGVPINQLPALAPMLRPGGTDTNDLRKRVLEATITSMLQRGAASGNKSGSVTTVTDTYRDPHTGVERKVHVKGAPPTQPPAGATPVYTKPAPGSR